jgi:hypothetical protein
MDTTQTPRPSAMPAFLPALLLVAAVTAWRLYTLAFHAPNLSFDEAQYWAWAQTLSLGYYSKPPMVAWAIHATTALCGEAEGCVKLGSTVAQTLTAILLFFLGRRLYGAAAGAWSAVLWATLPAVSLSSVMITTDPFLLVFWAGALLCLAEAAERGPAVNRWWLLLGACFGLGMLAKYAMALFLLSAVLWLATSPDRRRLARGPGPWAALALGLAFYAPNVIWNATNGFVSYRHTADNAHLGGELFHPDKLAEFVGGQFGVFGPILMAALLAGLALSFRRGADGRARMLAWFTAPVLLIMMAESLLSRANANWTAPAYVAGTVLVAGWLAERRRALLWASLGLHLAAAGVLYHMDAVRGLLALPDSARYDPMKKLRGWDEVGRRVSAHLAATPGARLLSDQRTTLATLIYYVRPHPFDGIKWNPGGRIHDHFDQTTRLEPGTGPLILVSEEPEKDIALILKRFERVQLLEDIHLPLHADYERAARVYRLDGFKGYE